MDDAGAGYVGCALQDECRCAPNALRFTCAHWVIVPDEDPPTPHKPNGPVFRYIVDTVKAELRDEGVTAIAEQLRRIADILTRFEYAADAGGVFSGSDREAPP